MPFPGVCMRPMVTSCYASPACAPPQPQTCSVRLPRVLHSPSPARKGFDPRRGQPSEGAAATPRGRRDAHSCLCAVSLQRACCAPRLTPHRRASGSAADVDLGALSRRAAVCLLPAPHSNSTVARACAVATVSANTPRSHPEARSTDHGKKPWPCPRPPVTPSLQSDAQ
jgi:hypothetical protein